MVGAFDRNPARQLADLQRQVAALERRLGAAAGAPATAGNGPAVSTAFGALSVRTVQPGFPAELTSGWNATTGYSWKQLALAGVGLVNPDVQLNGTNAVAADGNRRLTAGTRGWMEPDPTAGGWLFIAGAPGVGRTGSGSGSGAGAACEPDDDGFSDDCAPGDGDDVLAVRDTQCLDGTLYVTRGRLQIVQADGRLRNDWYDLFTTEEGCCECSGSGSGSGGGGDIGPCPPVGEVNVVITGPWGPGGEVVELPLPLPSDGVKYRTAGRTTFDSGPAVPGVEMVWVRGAWRLSGVVETADGDLVSVSSTLAESGTDGSLAGTALGGDATVSADDPCYTPPPPPDVFLPGCGTGYPATIYAEFVTGTGTCDEFTGPSFALAWNGTDGWAGTHPGTGTVVTLRLVGGAWTASTTAAGYTFTSPTVPDTFICGSLPTATTSITVGGDCTGVTQLLFGTTP